MRKNLILVLFVLSIALLSTPLFAQDDMTSSEPLYEIHQYNDHFYKITCTASFPLNVFVSIGEDGILLVDTGMPNDGTVILEAIRTISDAPINTVIITHAHGDHTGGLPVLGKDATIIAHEESIMDEYFALVPRRNFTGPTIGVDDVQTIHFNGEDIDIIPIPPGHFKGELLVHFKGSNVLCTGSRIIPGSYPFADYNAGCTIEELVGRTKTLAEEYPDVIFGTGHGYHMNADQANNYYNILTSTLEIINADLDAGKTMEEIVESNVLAPWDSLTGGFVSHNAWINLVIRSRRTEPAKPDMAKALTEVLEAEGFKSMVKFFKKQPKEDNEEYSYGEFTLNMLAYQLSYRDRLEEALKVFKMYTKEFPQSANAFDSYAEGHLMIGDTTKAIKLYEKAVEVDSTFQNAKNVLIQLRREK
jgi:cyclase